MAFTHNPDTMGELYENVAIITEGDIDSVRLILYGGEIYARMPDGTWQVVSPTWEEASREPEWEIFI